MLNRNVKSVKSKKYVKRNVKSKKQSFFPKGLKGEPGQRGPPGRVGARVGDSSCIQNRIHKNFKGKS